MTNNFYKWFWKDPVNYYIPILFVIIDPCFIRKAYNIIFYTNICQACKSYLEGSLFRNSHTTNSSNILFFLLKISKMGLSKRLIKFQFLIISVYS